MTSRKKDPRKCGSSFNLFDTVMCKELCAPCAILYKRRNVKCAVEQGEAAIKAFDRLLNKLSNKGVSG